MGRKSNNLEAVRTISVPTAFFMASKIDEIRKQLAEKPLQRSFLIERADVNEDTRTVNVAFASDKAIEHYWFALILTMDKKSMRTERLKSGAALLMDHNWRDQVGVVENFSIDNGVARADVRFSKSARGEEIYQDVLDGIRQNISVGFLVHEMHIESEEKGEMPVYRSDDWEPYEISLVSVPADISVGVGRSQNFTKAQESAEFTPTTEKRTMKEHEEPVTPVAANPAPADTTAARHKELIEWAALFGDTARDIAKITLLKTPAASRDDIRLAIVAAEDSQPAQARIPVEDARSAAARQGAPTTAELARSIPRYGRLRAFKGEGAEERAFRFGQFILGGPIGDAKAREFCKTHGLELKRAQSEGLNEKGGFLVPEDFGNDMIDLIESYGVFRRHAKIRPMSSDTASDPRITGELDAYFVGESSVGTESDFETDRVSLTAKKLMVLVNYSSEVSEDAVISIGDEIARLSARAFAKKEDVCGFNGDGTSTYGGIVGAREKLKSQSGTIANIAGLQVGTGNAYSELVLGDFRGVVARLPEYADQDAKWFVHRQFYWNVMVAALLAGGGVTATEIENARNQVFLGYPVVFAQVMPKAEANSQVCALFGDLAMAATLGDRRMYSVALSEHARFTADDWVFRATSRFDINVHSVGNVSATAADREAGPIVGLITAGS